jgi:hypothetical protein
VAGLEVVEAIVTEYCSIVRKVLSLVLSDCPAARYRTIILKYFVTMVEADMSALHYLAGSEAVEIR